LPTSKGRGGQGSAWKGRGKGRKGKGEKGRRKREWEERGRVGLPNWRVGSATASVCHSETPNAISLVNDTNINTSNGQCTI